MKDYMNNPTAYLVSERLNQLFIIYGKQYVLNNISNNQDNWLDMHINNIRMFSGDTVFFKTVELIKNKVA